MPREQFKEPGRLPRIRLGGTVQSGPDENVATNDLYARGGGQYRLRGLPFVSLGRAQTLFGRVAAGVGGGSLPRRIAAP